MRGCAYIWGTTTKLDQGCRFGGDLTGAYFGELSFCPGTLVPEERPSVPELPGLFDFGQPVRGRTLSPFFRPGNWVVQTTPLSLVSSMGPTGLGTEPTVGPIGQIFMVADRTDQQIGKSSLRPGSSLSICLLFTAWGTIDSVFPTGKEDIFTDRTRLIFHVGPSMCNGSNVAPWVGVTYGLSGPYRLLVQPCCIGLSSLGYCDRPGRTLGRYSLRTRPARLS